MPVWPYRHQLSLHDKLRRSIYEVLRDQMDEYLVQYALIDSYHNFRQAGEPYPFVLKRELKPRARVHEQEYHHQNRFLVIFSEGTVPNAHKKQIRFLDSNKVTKEALTELVNVRLSNDYASNLRYFDHPNFMGLLRDLLPVDYALLIQQDPNYKKRNRYKLSHFHVRIDWPITEATEDMAHRLRYISKDLYEKGDQYAEHLQNKLFENYGFHFAVGGRRTAAVVTAQVLKKMHFISTVYVSSAEARTLARISERGVSKFVLIKLPTDEVVRIAAENQLTVAQFQERFLVDLQPDHGVGIFQVVYHNTAFSKPPDDGKLRSLVPDYQWLTVSRQLLLPLPQHPDLYPIAYSSIYTPD